MNKKYAIFDMDGTLINSMDYWNNVIAEFFEKHGIKEDHTQLFAQMKTMNLHQSTALLSQLYPHAGTPEQMLSESAGIMQQHYQNDVVLKDGVAEYLSKLKAEGVRICLVTMSTSEVAKMSLGRLGVFDLFEFMLSGLETDKSKNTPELYLEAAKMLGAHPGEVAVFEDAFNAVKVAKEGGFYTVGVYDVNEQANWGSIKATADEAIESWRELL